MERRGALDEAQSGEGERETGKVQQRRVHCARSKMALTWADRRGQGRPPEGYPLFLSSPPWPLSSIDHND